MALEFYEPLRNLDLKAPTKNYRNLYSKFEAFND